MSVLCCPVCGQGLERDQKAYRCPKGHGFDRAASGYVHLLPPKEMHSKLPGDNGEMVAARAAFLSKGYYQALRDALAHQAAGLLEGVGSPAVLDAGCGEGYYTAGLWDALAQGGRVPRLAGLDLSKYALRRAAKRVPQAEFVAGSLFHLPVEAGLLHLVTDIFAPVCPQEFRRVLRDDGSLLLAVPAADHLWGLKKLLYQQPYENDEEPPDHPGFAVADRQVVRTTIRLDCQEDIWNLFMMTPYVWKTSKEATEKLRQTDCLETAASFIIYTMKKA